MKNRNELFVVLVVIGIVVLAVVAGLNGMMLPALNQAHEKQCINNLSQIGKGIFAELVKVWNIACKSVALELSSCRHV